MSIVKILEILFSTHRCTFCIAPIAALQKRGETPDVAHHQHKKAYMKEAPDVEATICKSRGNKGGGNRYFAKGK